MSECGLGDPQQLCIPVSFTSSAKLDGAKLGYGSPENQYRSLRGSEGNKGRLLKNKAEGLMRN